ncbi:hypothetical protein AX17_001094 [Amanita inopinata Kibby_2008]|nr:hypothetical protein AX17_001094 [Amanita inopinata Kibby_2008]
MILFLTVLVTTTLAWEKEDHEIFDLVSAVKVSEGTGTTFYSWLDVPPTASTADIAKAYRKLSMRLHPDKNLNVKGSHERFARLGVVASILRNQESRKRYDFFYKNGVPKWRGTGYYYSRFRPGLGTVFVFLTFFTSTLQYIIQRINYKKDLERVQYIIREARLAAWGPKLVPSTGQRKVKVNLRSKHDEDGYVDSSRFLDMVVECDTVYFLDPMGEMHVIDETTAAEPKFINTWFFKLIKFVFDSLKCRKAVKRNDLSEQNDSDDNTSVSDLPRSGTATPQSDGEKTSRHLPAAKTGGRRRKAVKKS